MNLSIVIPAYNEKLNLPELHKKIRNIGMLRKAEIIVVDDGSTDSTLDELKKLRKKDSNLKFISFSRNFKKASALEVGLERASGDIIITMDGDLQDDPSEIPNLLAKLDEGYDMVVGWKYPRQDPIEKQAVSAVFNWLIRRLTGPAIHDCDSNFRAIKKVVVPHLEIYAGLYRYIPVLAHRKGFRVAEIKVKHKQRIHGSSKYGLGRLYTGFLDLVTIKFLLDFNKQPLHLFGGIGSLFLGSGMLSGLYLLYVKYVQGLAIGQRPLLIFTILLLFLGLQLISIGLIGEMIAYMGRRKSGEYVIREEQGFTRNN